MYPSGNVPAGGIPPRGFPMVHPGNPQVPMMRPGMMYGGQTMPQQPMYHQQMNMNVQGGMVPPGMVPPGMVPPGMVPSGMVQPGVAPRQPGFAPVDIRMRPPPPQYTQDMAQQFKTKQGMSGQNSVSESQQRAYEQQLKQQNFQEQQKRLREFSAVGGRSMDADHLIKSIIGPTEKPITRTNVEATRKDSAPSSERVMNHNIPPQNADDDDGFGDFLGGPSHTSSTIPASNSLPAITSPSQLPVNQLPAGGSSANQLPVTGALVNQVPATGTMDNSVRSSSASQLPSPTSQSPSDITNLTPSSTTQPASHSGPAETQKPTVETPKKDLVSMMMQCSDLTAPKEAKSFAKKPTVKDVQQPKKKASSYKESQKARKWEADTNALSELFTAPETTESVLPRWITGDVPLPEVYTQVLEASLRDGQIDTDLLYPVLVLSGLSRETLGHIWSLCNKQQPGRLVREELVCVLALVSVAQNNIPFDSLDILKKCPQAPIPNLGQVTASSPQADPAVHQSQEVVTPVVTMTTQPTSPVSVTHASLPSDSAVTSFFAVTSPGATSPLSPAAAADDDFADFQSATAQIHTSSSFGEVSSPEPNRLFKVHPKINASAPNLMGSNINDHNRSNMLDLSGSNTGDHHRSTVPQIGSSAIATTEDEFGAFKSESSVSSFAAHTSATLMNIPLGAGDTKQESSKQPPVLNGHVSSPQSQDADEFADFQQANSSSQKPETVDKYAALKALVMNEELYEKKVEAEEDIGEKLGDVSLAEDGTEGGDWAGFSSHSAQAAPTEETDDWANFESASETVSWDQKQSKDNPVSTNTSATTVHNTLSTPSTTSVTQSMKPDKTKANKMFEHNLRPSVPAGTGISPLDTLPPDFPPETPPDDLTSGVNFDHFGMFQGTTDPSPSEGLSSIALDNIDLSEINTTLTPSRHQKNIFTLPNQGTMSKSSTRDTFDTQSTCSLEFTKNHGKTPKDDTFSASSLEFKESKDMSPVGFDCQSVNSMEMVGESRTTPSDKLSVASLDLKTSENEVQSRSYLETDLDRPSATETDFGDFNSAPSGEAEPRPREVSDLMTRGDVSNMADRYSGLTQEPEGLEQHMHDWQKCLVKCQEVLQEACSLVGKIKSPSILHEIIQSQKGTAYLTSVTEIYRVSCRIKQAMLSLAATSMGRQKLEEIIVDIEASWGTLTVFIASTHIMPPASSLNFHKYVLKSSDEDADQKACGVCLLAVSLQGSTPESAGSHQLTYAGRQYHTSCANFWLNRVDSTLPSLKTPQLI